MTNEQKQTVKILTEKYHLEKVPLSPAHIRYLIMMLCVGYEMTQEQIEKVMRDNNTDMVNLDIHRLCLFFDIPFPQDGKIPEMSEHIRHLVTIEQESESQSKRAENTFNDEASQHKATDFVDYTENSDGNEVTLENKKIISSDKKVEETTVQSNNSETKDKLPSINENYLNLYNSIMRQIELDPGQLDQVIYALHNGLTEEEILRIIGDTTRAPSKMKKLIDFALSTRNKKSKSKSTHHQRR